MKHLLLTATAATLFMASSAFAQDAAPAPESTMPGMSAPEANAPAMPSPEATAPAMPSPEATAPAAPAPEAAGQPMSTEAAQTPADWARFDNGNKGYLTALEFGNWLMAKQGNDMTAQVEKTQHSKQANLPAVKVLNATGTAFLKADKNGDMRITPDELAGYVAG